jgi:predicted AlkP superfamily pyrophosphatase or phosphodiesterase
LLGGHRSDLTLWWNKNKKSWEAFQEKLPEWLSVFNQRNSANTDELATPKGYDLTNALVQQVMEHEKLGQDPSRTDFLWISYSSFDYAGHAYGPNSVEMKQMTLAMDQAISDLISTLGKKTLGGLSSVLIALTGDHGVAPAPSELEGTGILAGKIDMDSELVLLENLVLKKFGKPKIGKWILDQSEMNLYLNPNAADEKRLKGVAQFLKGEIEKKDWVQGVLTLDEFREGKIPNSFPKEKVLKTIYPSRSGDIIILPKPFFIEYDPHDTAAHFTPYPYDCQVPLIMMGPGLKQGKKIPMKVDVADWAVTLSYLLGTQPPALSSGRILNEAIQD